MSSANVLQSLVWFSLRSDVDAHHVVEYVVCPLPFLKLGRLTRCGIRLRSCFDRHSIVVTWILDYVIALGQILLDQMCEFCNFCNPSNLKRDFCES